MVGSLLILTEPKKECHIIEGVCQPISDSGSVGFAVFKRTSDYVKYN